MSSDLFLVAGVVVAVGVGYFIYQSFFKQPLPKPPSQFSNTSNGNGTHNNKNKQQKAEPTEEKGLPMTILFGSQSGTAENFSYQLQKEAKGYGFNAKVHDLQNYDYETVLSTEKFVVFLMATFGEGEPTDNAVSFYEWITAKDNHEEESMKDVTFAVFGLGNRQYEHFCVIGKRVSKRMNELGGSELVEHGEGDDDGSLEDDYAEWRNKFWEVARKKYGVEGKNSNDLTPFEPTFIITLQPGEFKEDVSLEELAADPKESKIVHPQMDSKYNGTYLSVLENYELRQSTDNGSTHHVVLDLTNTRMKYITADNLGVYPRNDFKLVAKLAKRLGVHPKRTFTWKDKAGKRRLPFPSNCTVGDALLWYCDITSVPKRSLLEILATYATDPADHKKLLDHVHDNKALYLEDKKNILEVLEEVPSVKPPFEHFIEFCPRLVPRFYTISSSSKKNPTQIHITVSLTRNDKPRGRVHEGVCSTYLCNLRPGKDKVACFVRASTFRPVWDNKKFQNAAALPPMVMVGPGTGFAPFRGFLQEAQLLKEQGKTIGELIVYFGCQRAERDYIYKENFEEWQKGLLTKLYIAFSRQTAKKVYVQHLMEENGEYMWDLITNKGAYFYICGATGMGRDVRNCLVELAKKYGGMSEETSQSFLQELQNKGRYIQELWS